MGPLQHDMDLFVAENLNFAQRISVFAPLELILYV